MGNIYHEWNGTILTVTSDSGTSSSDLRGAKGDMGVRGAQGAKGDAHFTFEDLTQDQKEEIRGEVNIELANASYSNALKGKKADTAIAIDDVSPLAHKMAVKLSSKNLFDIPDLTPKIGEYSTHIVIECNITEPITISAVVDNPVILEDGEPISIWRFAFRYKDGETRYYMDAELSNGSKTIEATKTNPIIDITYRNTYITSGAYRNIQIEKGLVATPYVPYVAEDTQVTVESCGKNLFDIDASAEAIISNRPNRNSIVEFDGKRCLKSYEIQPTLVVPVIGNPKTISCNVYSEAIRSSFVCCVLSNGVRSYLGIDTEEKTNKWMKVTAKYANAHIVSLEFYTEYRDKPLYIDLDGFMLEQNYGATEYEPYRGETITTTIAEGAELTSIAPNMTITTDTAGALIELEYNKDANKVIETLVQAIISLGGNI